jgi:hypothetical protein
MRGDDGSFTLEAHVTLYARRYDESCPWLGMSGAVSPSRYHGRNEKEWRSHALPRRSIRKALLDDIYSIV